MTPKCPAGKGVELPEGASRAQTISSAPGFQDDTWPLETVKAAKFARGVEPTLSKMPPRYRVVPELFPARAFTCASTAEPASVTLGILGRMFPNPSNPTRFPWLDRKSTRL